MMASLNDGAFDAETANTEEISPVAPYVNMEFATIDEAKTYYEEYGKQHGFCTRQRDIRRNIPRSDQVTSLKLVCAREGKQRQTEETYAPEQERYTVTSKADDGPLKGKKRKGSRLGITTVISTDSIRHMMRSFAEEEQNPLLWASTYHAGECLDPVAIAGAKAKRKAKKLAGITTSLSKEAISDALSGGKSEAKLSKIS